MKEKVNGNIHTTPLFSSKFTVSSGQEPIQEVQASDLCCRNTAGANAGRFGYRNLVPCRMDVLIATDLQHLPKQGCSTSQTLLRPVRRLTVKVLTLIVSRFGLTVWSEVQRLVGSVGVEALPD